MSLYLVTGERAYREHPPGSTFEAVLPPDSERRAIRFGAVTLIERGTPGIRAGCAKLPDGWVTRQKRSK